MSDIVAATTTTPALGEALERAIAKNDFSQVSAEDRIRYLRIVCESLRLNPLTMPLAYLMDRGGKISLYVRKDGTEQLRKLHGVSLEIVSQVTANDCYTVHVRASSGFAGSRRTDEDIGVVSVAGLKGEQLANAMMKAITKAKRRATLSLCGLGLPDESEVEDTQTLKPVAEQVQPPALPAPPPQQHQQQKNSAKDVASAEQIAELRRLKDLHKIDAPTWLKILNKRDVGSAKDLTPVQADELIHAMAAKAVAQQMEQDAVAGGKPSNGPAFRS